MAKCALVVFALLLVVPTAFGQWTQQTSPVSSDLIGVCFTSSTDGWIVGAGGTLLRTIDGGAHWTVRSVPTTENLNKIAFLDPQHGYIVGDRKTLLVTTDGGNLWKLVYSGYDVFANYYDIEISDDHSRGWMAGGWQAWGSSVIVGMQLGYCDVQFEAVAGRCVGVDFVGNDLGWVVGMDRLILKTTDGGSSWTQQAGTAGAAYTGLNGIQFFNNETGLAVGDGGVILKTTNGGTEWYAVRENNEVLFCADVRTNSVAYVVGSAATILKSTDQGETWQSQQTPSSVYASVTLMQSFFVDPAEGWIVGTGGTILHTMNGGGQEPSWQILPDRYYLATAYPNPFNPSTTITYALPQTSDVSLAIFDQAGKIVEAYPEGETGPGRYEIQWSAAGHASGVYYVRLSAKRDGLLYTATQKIVLMK